MENPFTLLKQLSDLIHPLTNEEWKAFSSPWKPFSAKKQEILTHNGETEKYLYFVLDGVQRIYYEDAEGREATLIFTYAPSFGGVLDSMLLGIKSKYYYKTISKSSFLRIPFSDVRELMSRHEGIRLLILKGASHAMAGLLERMVELQCYSSEEKFKKLLSRSPHILQHVPQKYLANYLGIDPTNFSKFVNRIVI